MKISAAMIVKDEERCILRCLESLEGVVDEIVVVDTGSTDSTIKIIRQLQEENKNIKLYSIEWENDFAKARNFALSKCEGDWIFSIDADETVSPEDKENLRNTLLSLKKADKITVFSINLVNIIPNGIKGTQEVLRVFPNIPLIKYSRSIHETIDESLENCDYQYFHIQNFTIKHDGYNAEVVNLIEKRIRNLQLLQKMTQEHPNDFTYLYYFGRDCALFDVEKSKKVLDYVAKHADKPYIKEQAINFLKGLE